jgi:DNA repair protein RecO (recombination protein O)
LTIETTPAVILRVKDLGESDLLVTFITPQKGRLKGVAKGARKSRKRFVNALDLFSLVTMEYSHGRQGNLVFLHSARLVDAYPGLRSDFPSLSKASYMIELTEALFPPGVAEPRMFDLLTLSLDALSRGGESDLVPLIFEFKAMSLGGYRIDAGRCSKCGRPYRREGIAVFVRERGGIACLKCAQPSANFPTLKPASVEAIETFQNRTFSELMELSLGVDIMKELRVVLKLHREYRLEQRLRTSKYVE